MDFTIKLNEKEIQILSNIISNSSPTVPFGVISEFVQNIDKQIRAQAPPAEDETTVGPQEDLKVV